MAQEETRYETLIQAAMADDADDMRKHVQLGANVNQKFQLQPGQTVSILHLIAFYRRLKAVECLLKEGADPNITDSKGTTPIQMPIVNGDLSMVRALLTGGANANTREPRHQRTLLHLAASEGHVEIVRLLLKHGADKNAVAEGGVTPRFAAVFARRPDIAQLL